MTLLTSAFYVSSNLQNRTSSQAEGAPVSKKPSVPDSPANKCMSSEKATAIWFAVGDEKTLCRQCLCLALKLSPNRSHCLQVCVVVLRHCLPPFYSSDCDLCSCGEHLPLVKELSVGPVAPVTLSRGTVACSVQREPSGTYIFSCPVG